MYRGHTLRVDTLGFQSKSWWISSTDMSQGNVPLPCSQKTGSEGSVQWKASVDHQETKELFSRQWSTNLCELQVFKRNVTHLAELWKKWMNHSEPPTRFIWLLKPANVVLNCASEEDEPSPWALPHCCSPGWLPEKGPTSWSLGSTYGWAQPTATWTSSSRVLNSRFGKEKKRKEK